MVVAFTPRSCKFPGNGTNVRKTNGLWLPKFVKPGGVCTGCLMMKQSRRPFSLSQPTSVARN